MHFDDLHILTAGSDLDVPMLYFNFDRFNQNKKNSASHALNIGSHPFMQQNN